MSTPDPHAEDIADLYAQVGRLTAELDRVQAVLEDLQAAGPPAGDASVVQAPPFLLLLNRASEHYRQELAGLVRWVNLVVVPNYGREVTGAAPWCAQWWAHPEAVARLHAAWLAWQGLTDPQTGGVTGPSVWHRDHLDPALLHLRSPQGPFSACMTNPDSEHHEDLLLPRTQQLPGNPN